MPAVTPAGAPLSGRGQLGCKYVERHATWPGGCDSWPHRQPHVAMRHGATPCPTPGPHEWQIHALATRVQVGPLHRHVGIRRAMNCSGSVRLGCNSTSDLTAQGLSHQGLADSNQAGRIERQRRRHLLAAVSCLANRLLFAGRLVARVSRPRFRRRPFGCRQSQFVDQE